MLKSVKRKMLNGTLREIKAQLTQRNHPNQEKDDGQFKRILFFHLATSFGKKGNRLKLRVLKTHLLRIFGDNKEGQELFSKEFKEYVEEMTETASALKRANDAVTEKKDESSDI